MNRNVGASVALLVVGSMLAHGPITSATGQGKRPTTAVASPERLVEMLEWNRKTLGEAYEEVGKKNERWDTYAKTGLDGLARAFSDSRLLHKLMPEIHQATERALAAGCDDGLVLYAYARSLPASASHEELEKHYLAATNALAASAYPPIRRAAALKKAAEWRYFRKARHEEVEKLVTAFLDLLPASAEQDPPGKDLNNFFYETADLAFAMYKKIGVHPAEALLRVEKVLASRPELQVARLVVRGNYYIKWAWEARGSGYAKTVTKEGWARFHERLDEAKTCLERAWALDASNRWAPSLMMRVQLGHSEGRAKMETWFQRATALNPDDYDAHWMKLEWIHPKWYGDSEEEYIAYARHLRDTKRPATRIPLLLVSAHDVTARRLPDKEAAANYRKRPDVYEDIKGVYKDYLAVDQKNHVARSLLAYHLYHAERFVEAHEQFQILGDHLWWDETYSEQLMKKIRDNVASRVAAAAAPAGKTPGAENR
jgi:hypothetical protein